MAKKKSKAAHGPLSAQYNSDVIKSIGVVGGRSLLDRLWPGARILQRTNSVLRFPCPIHSDTDPSMDIDFVKGTIHCYGCKYHTNSIFRFLQDAKGWIYREALDQLRQITSAKVFSDSATKELDSYDVYLYAVKVWGDVCNTHLQNLLSPTNPMTEYNDILRAAAASTVKWLFEERGRNPDLVSRLPYGVLPPKHLFDKLVVAWFSSDLDRRRQNDQNLMEKSFKESVSEKLDELWKGIDTNYIHSVICITGYSLTTPGRIRMRRPHVPKEEGLKVLPGFEADSPNGFYGLYNPAAFASLTSKEAPSLDFYVVEGEQDANACMEGVFAAGKTGILFIASCGGANDTDALLEAGIHRTTLVGDDPMHGNGDEWVKGRLKTASEIDVMVFSRWDIFRLEAPGAKDPDEVIRAIGFERFHKVVIEGGRGHYRTATEWSIDKITDEIQQKKVEADNARAITEIAGRYGQCVSHPASQAAYIDRVAQLFQIPPGPLRQQIVQGKDTEESFRMRLTERLRYEFHALYKETHSKGQIMALFHKVDREVVKFPMSDGESIAIALTGTHGNFYDYVKSHVGIPTFLMGEDKDGMPLLTPEKAVVKDLYFYMKLAAQDLFKGLPEKTACIEYNQGWHKLEDPARPGEIAIYMVNGMHVYKGTFTSPMSTMMEWTELSGPGEGKYLFKTRSEPWSVEVSSVQDLMQGNSITLAEIRKTIELIAKVVTENWSFVHQDTDPMFIAYHLFASAVTCAFPTKVILSFIGDHHSGKSTILSLFSGVTNKALQILECSRSLSDFSPAGVYQPFNRATLSMVIDEFEDDGENSAKGRAVTDLTALMRNMIGEQGTRITRGTADGSESNEYVLHTFVTIASILRARKVQDESRRFDVEMRKNELAKDPAQGLFATVSHDDWMRVRRLLTLGMPKLILLLEKSYKMIDRTVNTVGVVPFPVSVRYLRNLFPACALMDVLGYDWKSFMIAVCEGRKMKLKAVASDTASAVLYDRMMRTPGIKLGEVSRATATLLELFSDEKEAALINASRSGVYFMPDSKICIINWIAVQSKGGLLDYWPEYRSYDHRNLKHTFDQNGLSLRTDDYETKGVKEFVQNLGDQYRPDLISAIDLSEVINDMRQHKHDAALASATGNVVDLESRRPNAEPKKPAGGNHGGENNIV